jgi:hypothetical protein
MNYEEQILELKKRIELLEKQEKKRNAKKKLKIIFELSKFLIIIIIIGLIYFNYIKPIADKINYVEDKVGNVEDYIDEKIDLLNKFNPFS